MRGTDIEAIGELAGEALAAGGGFIREMHEGIAGRPFGVLGPAGAPARVVHDGISQAVYGGVRNLLRGGARGSASLLARRSGDEGPALAATPAGSLALGAINGLYGNHLTERGHRLAFGMAVRRCGDDVALTSDGIAAAFPDATSRIAVFVHGLFGDEDNWRLFPLVAPAPGGARTASACRMS